MFSTFFCVPAIAQDPPAGEESGEQPIEEVIVTGSRIPRAGFESLQPAVVIGHEELEARGILDIGTVLREQAGFTPGVTPIGNGGISVGQSLPDFLGLGYQRTLTLVNGHRFPSSTSESLAVDLNAIPEALIDRVETIAIGGAPIYGSDAIAGTVNVILRDDFDGFEFQGSAGRSVQYGDADERRFSALWGRNFGDGRGNIALAVQVKSVEGLIRTDRPETEKNLGFEAPADPDSPFALVLFDDLVLGVESDSPNPLFFGNQFFLNTLGNGIPLDLGNPGVLSQFDADGNLVPFVPGARTGSVIAYNGGDGYKLPPVTPLFTDLDRYNANLFLRYDLTERLTVKAEAWLARTEGTEPVNQPDVNSPLTGGLPANGFGNVGLGPIPILMENPFLTDAARTIILDALNVVHDFDGDGAADPTIDTDGDGVPDRVGFWRGGSLKRIMGDKPNSSVTDTWRLLLSLAGEVALAGREFSWDASYSEGRVTTENTELEIIQSNFEQAVQVVADASGDPACADQSNGCVPLDVLGTPSRDAIDFVSEWLTDVLETEQRVFTANIGGDVLDLPAGPLGFAAGFTYREEEADFDPSDLSEQGLSRSTSSPPVSAGFDSAEFYAEAVVPLLGDGMKTPGVDTLEFEGAIRYVDNSVAGDDTTWTAGLRYRPIPDLELRGNVTESIRAPSIEELFLPAVMARSTAADPCDQRFINEGNVPERRAANCAADGITQPFQSIIVNVRQPGSVSGNPDLTSEKAESYTFGLVVRSSFLDGLTAAIDWLNIEIGNAIAFLNPTEILNACYDSASFPNESTCALFTRDADGQIDDFRAAPVNVDRLEFAGLHTVLHYATGLGRFGDLSLSVNHLYTDKLRETQGSGNTARLEGQIPFAKHRVTANATWRKGKWTLFSQFRWIDQAVFSNQDDEFTRDVKGVGDWLAVNSGLAYEFNENLRIQLNIDNLFDRDPPYPAVASINGIRGYFPGILGRYARLQVRYRR